MCSTKFGHHLRSSIHTRILKNYFLVVCQLLCVRIHYMCFNIHLIYWMNWATRPIKHGRSYKANSTHMYLYKKQQNWRRKIKFKKSLNLSSHHKSSFTFLAAKGKRKKKTCLYTQKQIVNSILKKGMRSK